MPKRYTFRADDECTSIINKYSHDHGCKEAEALRRIIKAYPLLIAKSQTSALGDQLKKTIDSKEEREPVMPDLCKHIVEINIQRDEVLCARGNQWVKARMCQKCMRREPIDAS